MTKFQEFLLRILGLRSIVDKQNIRIVDLESKMLTVMALVSGTNVAGIDRTVAGDTTVAIISKFQGGKLHIIDNIVVRSEAEWNELLEYISKEGYVNKENIIGNFEGSSFRRSNVPMRFGGRTFQSLPDEDDDDDEESS